MAFEGTAEARTGRVGPCGLDSGGSEQVEAPFGPGSGDLGMAVALSGHGSRGMVVPSPRQGSDCVRLGQLSCGAG